MAVDALSSDGREGATVRPDPQWRAALRVFFSNWAAVAGLIVLLSIAAVAVFGPLLLRFDPLEMAGPPLARPGEFGLLGTDYLGRDVFAGIVHGSRATLLVGLAAMAVTLVIGVTVGSLAGYYGRWVDGLLMRGTEFFQVLPNLVFAMVLVTIFGPSTAIVIITIGVVSWTPIARLTRAEFLRIRELDYVKAARAIGARNRRIIWRVVIPNALPPLVVSATLLVGTAILFAAALSFLGLSDPDVVTWGLMIGQSRNYIWDSWWAVTFPGVAILVTVLSIALVGDGLNDALNPRLRGRN